MYNFAKVALWNKSHIFIYLFFDKFISGGQLFFSFIQHGPNTALFLNSWSFSLFCPTTTINPNVFNEIYFSFMPLSLFVSNFTLSPFTLRWTPHPTRCCRLKGGAHQNLSLRVSGLISVCTWQAGCHDLLSLSHSACRRVKRSRLRVWFLNWWHLSFQRSLLHQTVIIRPATGYFLLLQRQTCSMNLHWLDVVHVDINECVLFLWNGRRWWIVIDRHSIQPTTCCNFPEGLSLGWSSWGTIMSK